MKAVAIAVMIGAAMAAGSAQAAAHQQAKVLRDLADCRAIADNAARLACYDGKVAAVVQAESSGDIVVADKAQIKEAKRALFGFGGVRLPFIGGGDDDNAAPPEITAKLTGARQSGLRWEFTLDNGMRWRQVDDEEVYPGSGQQVIVKRGAMGSYIMKIKSRAVRVIRIQ